MPQRPLPDPRLAPTLGCLGARPRASLEGLSELGFRRVQLSSAQESLRPRELDRSGRRELLSLLRRLDMTAGGLDVWVPPARLRETQSADRAVEAIKEAIVLAADLGRLAVTLTLPAPGPPEGNDLVLDALVEHAMRHGVALADAAAPPAARPDVGVAIDPVAWLARGDDPIAAVQTQGQRIVSARLGDLSASGQRTVPGSADGRLDVDGYRRALRNAGYGGTMVVDLRGAADPWRDLPAYAASYMPRSDAM